MALTVFEILVVGGLVFQVGFLIALLRDRTQQACVIDTIDAHATKLQRPPQPGERKHGYLWRRAAMFLLPLFLIPTGFRVPSSAAGDRSAPLDSARECQ